jgi:hypothetical protein
MRELIEHGLMQHFESSAEVREQIAVLEREVVQGQKTSFCAAQKLLDIYMKTRGAS